jgi:hypothetical protein
LKPAIELIYFSLEPVNFPFLPLVFAFKLSYTALQLLWLLYDNTTIIWS